LATAQELWQAQAAAWCAYDTAARAAYDTDAAYAAAYATYHAARSVGGAAAAAARQRQTELFRKLCQGTAPWQS
jgi:hypothetical protein